MHTPIPSADVCTNTTHSDKAEVAKVVTALRKKLARWELEHLRNHCAELSNQLDEAKAQIERLTEEKYHAWSEAEAWREDVDRLIGALDAAGQQVGLTQGGELVPVGEKRSEPRTPNVDKKQDLRPLLLAATQPGIDYTITELVQLLNLPNSLSAIGATADAAKACGFVERRAPYTEAGRVLSRAPACQGLGECHCEPAAAPCTPCAQPAASQKLDALPSEQPPQDSQQPAAQPGQTLLHQTSAQQTLGSSTIEKGTSLAATQGMEGGAA